MYKKKKVAAYCCVSTDLTDQLNSLATQRNYFNEYINNHDEWELVEALKGGQETFTLLLV